MRRHRVMRTADQLRGRPQRPGQVESSKNFHDLSVRLQLAPPRTSTFDSTPNIEPRRSPTRLNQAEANRRRGQISRPPMGSSPGHQWAVSWPPMGTFSWPPTAVAGLLVGDDCRHRPLRRSRALRRQPREGGILSLITLLPGRRGGDRPQKRVRTFLATLGVFGASLFLADSMITAAISVLSAVEGIRVVQSELEPLVIPLTVVMAGARASPRYRQTRRLWWRSATCQLRRRLVALTGEDPDSTGPPTEWDALFGWFGCMRTG